MATITFISFAGSTENDSTGSKAEPVSTEALRNSWLSFTVSPVTGLPLWRVMPGRMAMVHVMKSADGVNDWARLGWITESAS
jgi:hypothetical protein